MGPQQFAHLRNHRPSSSKQPRRSPTCCRPAVGSVSRLCASCAKQANRQCLLFSSGFAAPCLSTHSSPHVRKTWQAAPSQDLCVCADCSALGSEWASVSYGIYLCAQPQTFESLNASSLAGAGSSLRRGLCRSSAQLLDVLRLFHEP